MNYRDLVASLPYRTLDGTLRLHAERNGERLALVDRAKRFTYAELEAAVDAVAGHLRRLGLRRGGSLVAFPQRTWELPVLFLATARAGGVFTPLDGRADPARVQAIVGQGVDLAFVAPEFDQAAEVMARALQDPARVIRGGAQGNGSATLIELIDGRPGPGPSGDPEAVCYLNYTSGSTGVPKGAPTTHANLQWNTRGVLDTFPFREDEVFSCLFAPQSHPHEHWARPLSVGGTCVMIDNLRPRFVLQSILEHRVTWLFAIPSVFELLMTAIPAGERFASPLRICEAGGAVVTPDLVSRGEASFGCDFLPIWGCTEATGVVLHVPPWERDRRRPEMLGKPVAHYEIDVIDADPVTLVGELAVRGAAVVAGYRDRPEETAQKFRDGWYLTGDLVKAEPDGYVRFMGRREEMIKVGGVKVYLLEVERIIAELPGVAQVVVVPATDRFRGEIPRAVIVPRAGARLTQDEVVKHCRARMAAQMVPRRVEFWDELPATGGGKIDKRAVADRVTYPLALAVNSMIIAARPMDEVFRLARGIEDRYSLPSFVDLRSRRSPQSDPGGAWRVAHDNSDFDLGDPASVDRAVQLAGEHGIQICATSAYLGACQPGDYEYGFQVIDQAYRLAHAAPDGTLLLRVLGGDLWARARTMPGRWHDVRRQLRDESLGTIRQWEAHTRQRASETGHKVVLGLEIHHGQYLSDLHDIHHCCRGLRDVGWAFVGFLEDPANRFIASEGELMGAMDFARVVRALGGRIVGYHLKDVRYQSPWSQFHPQPLQRVGDRVFVWGMHKYEWVALGSGEIDLAQVLMAAQHFAQPPFPWCPVSAEYVAASTTEQEAAEILDSYATLLRDGQPA
jgi:acyl-CoA synthetase (AMP-forming)/AMP-acid ligase II/sugar phosphate isomerase/epimerase